MLIEANDWCEMNRMKMNAFKTKVFKFEYSDLLLGASSKDELNLKMHMLQSLQYKAMRIGNGNRNLIDSTCRELLAIPKFNELKVKRKLNAI